MIIIDILVFLQEEEDNKENETSEKFRGLFKTIQEQQPGLLKSRKKKVDKRRQRKKIKKKILKITRKP